MTTKKRTMISMMTLLQAVAVKAGYSVGSDEWVHYYYELFGALVSFSAFVGMVALLVDGKWWLWTTYKSRPHLSLCPLMMVSIPPSPAPDLVTTPTPFLPPVSSPGPLPLPFPDTASSPSPSPAPVPAPEPVQVPAVVKATRVVAGLASAQSQQQHQKKKKKTQKKKAGESKPRWRV
ncbi:hypothetical protein TsFJ059_009458 [Trichoderma semiorbis]|uniref:Uncharacterized protein n=1 Tax=Trichoderma semiorbis TaxID=1491008 RepID=A0A9P8HE56_9HYPO|nr:hypothetical protein TsFJ059_009458 [Trichoderma semiorbis]